MIKIIKKLIDKKNELNNNYDILQNCESENEVKNAKKNILELEKEYKFLKEKIIQILRREFDFKEEINISCFTEYFPSKYKGIIFQTNDLMSGSIQGKMKGFFDFEHSHVVSSKWSFYSNY